MSATAPERAGATLGLRLFGSFELCRAGEPLPRVRTRYAHWLLALLALRPGQEIERGWLAGTLWPDSSGPLAYRSLRSCLADLRRCLAEDARRLVSPTPRTLCLDLVGVTVDVLAFDAAIARGDPASLEEAVALYRGPLLEGCVEPWAFQERQAREQAYLAARERLAALAFEGGDIRAAEQHLRVAVGTDPLRESPQRALMQVLAASGNYAVALQIYRELRLLLHRELNTEPDAETRTLFDQLRREARRLAAKGPRALMPESEAGSGPLAGTVDGDLARPADFPSGVASQDNPNNLPVELTRFIGREAAIARVKQLFATARLLTLTGSGGCGKTRLVLRVAADLLEQYPDGAWLVELAPLADPALVPQTVASTLGVREQPGRPLTVTLTEYLRPKSLLLILDNGEHLLAACAQLAENLLRGCPQLRILATSREGLGIEGEQTYRVPSLSLPGIQVFRGSGVQGPTKTRPAFDLAGPEHLNTRTPEHLNTRTPEYLLQFEAVQLFVDRARLRDAAFTVTGANAAAVAQVCRRLDGIPLAIELAAARVKALPVEKLNERLDDMFRLLTLGSRTALPRQQTLRGLIDWSYDLLSPAEQGLLRRLSVFAGGWTLDAAEAVCMEETVAVWEVLDLLTSLVDKSLVLYDAGARGGEGGEADSSGGRYRLLETVRQYARDRLLAGTNGVGEGEGEAARDRHRDWFLALAEEAEPQLHKPDQAVWLERLDREHDNLRAALAWTVAQGQGEVGLRLGVALWPFWHGRGYSREGREQLAGLLALPGAEARTAARAQALHGAGWLVWDQGDYEAARALFEESLGISRGLGRQRGIASSLGGLGWAALSQGDYGAARALLEEALAIFREIGHRGNIAWSLAGLGNVARDQGDHEAARALFAESVAIRREEGDTREIAYSLSDAGKVAHDQGDNEAARALFGESLALFRELVNRDAIASTLHNLGRVALSQQDIGAAREFFAESLAVFRELGKPGSAGDLEGLAAVAILQAQYERAARLFGAAEEAREAAGTPLRPADRAEHDRCVAAVRTALGEAAFTAAWAAGREMSLEEAVRYAFQVEDADAYLLTRPRRKARP